MIFLKNIKNNEREIEGLIINKYVTLLFYMKENILLK